MSNVQLIVSQIQNNNGILRVSSRDVATNFGKEHYNVIRDIRNILLSGDESDALNFEGVNYVDAKGESRPEYLMNRDGFTLLVMGFTGPEAMEFKRAYIAAFNEMETKLKAVNVPLPGSMQLLEAMFAQVKSQDTKLQAIATDMSGATLSTDQILEMETKIKATSHRCGTGVKNGWIKAILKVRSFGSGNAHARTWDQMKREHFADNLAFLDTLTAADAPAGLKITSHGRSWAKRQKTQAK